MRGVEYRFFEALSDDDRPDHARSIGREDRYARSRLEAIGVAER